jgi:diguanylate cyclase (GGDEF)-like protein/PAS domain S-box-containing protein
MARSTTPQLAAENKDLRARLERAEESVREILSGEADALFVPGAGGAQLFTLKGADQSYRTLIENMSEGALTLTAEGLILYANRRFAQMLGTPLERVIGSEIHAWFSPESREVLQTLLQKNTVANRSEELALAAADGTQVPVYLSVSRLVLDNMPDSFCMVATDLTEQKRTEAVLAAEEFARAILEQAADAIVICDRTGRIIRASKQAQVFCGQNAIGRQFEDAFPLRQLNGAGFSPVGAIDPTPRHSVEATLDHGGRGFDLLVSLGHLTGARNEMLGSVVTLTDITERKLAEQALSKSEGEFRTLAESMPQIVWITRADGWNIYFNQRWMDYTGLTLEESLGDGWNKPQHPDDQKGAWDAWQKSTATASIYSIESRLRRADGTYRWMLVRGVPLKDAAGTILKWFGTCTDIDDMKVAELSILDSNRTLRENEISIKRLNRVYTILSGINALIVRARNCDDLFREACQIAVKQGQFRMAWIGVIDRSAGRTVLLASAGVGEDWLTAIKERLSEDPLLGDNMAARAIREKKAVVVNDLRSSLEITFGKKYADSGIFSIATLPLIVSDEAIGVMVLYASEIAFFHEEELKLLKELAGDIAFAVDHIDKGDRLSYIAYYDELTGLANRSLFIERVAQYIRSVVGSRSNLAVGVLDLERFKNINHSLGRPAGDALLKQVAEWLTRDLGDTNLLARVGADHFAFVLPDIKHERDVPRLIEKALEAFAKHPFMLNDAVYRVAAKVGVAVFPDDGQSADILFRNAEIALRKAKVSGDRYTSFAQKMSETGVLKPTLESQLRDAIDNDEFVLYYQPKVNIVSGKLSGAEALIRWNDPRRGLVPPAEFIPILEETGLIFEVGRWALHKAVKEYLRWRAAGLPAVRIAVNVSPLQVRNTGFVAEIEEAIAIDPHAGAGLGAGDHRNHNHEGSRVHDRDPAGNPRTGSSHRHRRFRHRVLLVEVPCEIAVGYSED